jgi:uncharacterized repeat protein (TIGR01451 family)
MKILIGMIKMKKQTSHFLKLYLPLLASLFYNIEALAIGTDAGTPINNIATVSFTTGGTQQTAEANISFNVDEVINVNVTATPTSGTITNGDKNVVLSYTISNIGNGPENFKLVESLGTNNSLPLTLGDLKVYIDKSSSPVGFDPTDTLYTDTDITISNDESITVYIVTDVPNASVKDTLTDLVITAISQTEAGGTKASESSFGSVIPTAGEGSTNAIIAVEQGRDSASSELKVSVFDPSKALSVVITKTILGSNALINNTSTSSDQKIPGALVTYFIKLVVKNDTANSVVINDVIPANMTYVPSSLRRKLAPAGTITAPVYIAPALPAETPATYPSFTPLTDSESDSDGAKTIPNTGTVTSISVDLNDLTPGEYAILLDAKINN